MRTGEDKDSVLKGEFWLPDDQDHKLVGELRFEATDGPEVELVGGSIGHRLRSGPRLFHGKTSSGPCTIVDCRLVEESFGAGIRHSRFKPWLVVDGFHLESVEDRSIAGIRIGFEDLTSWCGFNCFELVESDAKSTEPRACRFSSFPEVEVKSGNRITTLAGGTFGRWSERELAFGFSNHVSTQLIQAGSLDSELKNAHWIRDFVTFLTWQPAKLGSLFVDCLPSKLGSNEKKRARVYGAGFPSQRRESYRERMLLTRYADMRDILPTLLIGWFGADESFQSILKLFVSLIRDRDQFVQLEFLALTQVCEAFHRSTSDGKYMDAHAYSEVARILTMAIPSKVAVDEVEFKIEEDHRQSLGNRIRFGNEVSQRRRLTELTRAVPDPLRSSIAGPVGSFVERVVNSRNYLTHRDENTKNTEVSPVELEKDSQRLKLLLQVHFLNRLGVGFPRIAQLYGQCGWSNWFLI